MVGVLVAISIVPMLILTNIVTPLVEQSFNNDVEFWLFQTSRYFLAEILDDEHESAEIAQMLVEDGGFDSVLSGASDELPAAGRRMIDALGFDLLIIYEDGKVLYSSKPVESLTARPFADGHEIFLFRDGKATILMEGGSYQVTRNGHSYRIVLGQLIDKSFTDNLHAMVSLAIRLYYRIDGKFVQMYSARGQASHSVPPSIIAALEAKTNHRGYVSARDSSQDQSFGIYAPLKANGDLVGVIFCGLTAKAGNGGWLTPQNLFLVIFAFGMLLSLGVGLLMSQFLTRPLVRLANGVNAIAKGDFSQRVPVGRNDELGQLARAFNSMAQQLEGLRKMEIKLRRRERLTTLGEVAAGLAHEVRNPLGIIKTSAELLRKSPHLNEVESRRLGYVVDEVRRIDQLIRDFLFFAKPPRRTTEILPVEMIEQVLGICQSEIERQGVEVRIKDDSGGAKVRLDLDQMIQSCLNLVLNALQAMDSGPGPVGTGRRTPYAGHSHHRARR